MPTININGRELHYLDEGEGFPILWGHSFLWDSQMWAPQIEALVRQYHCRCIVPDLWSHGHSAPLSQEDYTFQELADTYWNLMQHLGFKEFAIVGLSVGGMWGVKLTLDHPEAVKALVIMDTYVGPEPEDTQKKYLGMLAMMEKDKGVSEALAERIAPLFFSPKTLEKDPSMIQRLKQDLMNITEEKIPGVATLGRMIFTRASALEDLPKITQPSLVVVGADDIPRPPAEAKEMAALLPNTQLEIIEEAGHIANREKIEAVNLLLGSFLKEKLNLAPKISCGMRR